MKNKIKIKLIFYLILGGFFFKIFKFFYKKIKIPNVFHNLKEFLKGEEREVEELSTGKESFKKYCRDSRQLFRDYFIPHEGNSHKPKILRSHSLAVIVLAVFMLKIFVTGYLFFIYPNTGEMSVGMTNQILAMINEDRAKDNLEPLSINAVLSTAAMAKADDMVMRDYFDHYGPDGKKPWDWIDRGQYAYLFVGENLAMNFSSAQSAHTALMASPTHKENILNGRYRDVGLAIVSGKIDGKETNVLVELFGSRVSPYLATAANTNNSAGSTAEQTVTSEPAMTPEAQAPAVAAAATEPAKPPAQETQPAAPAQPAPAEKVEAPVNSSGTEAAPDRQAAETPPLIARSGEQPAENAEGVDTLAMADTAVAQDNAAPASPNPELEENPDAQPTYFKAVDNRRIGFATRMIETSKYIYLGLLILVIASLLINILVRVSVQHKHVIIQSLVVILLLAGLLAVHMHILETIPGKIAVI